MEDGGDVILDGAETACTLEDVDGPLYVIAGDVGAEFELALAQKPVELLAVDVVHADGFEMQGVGEHVIGPRRL